VDHCARAGTFPPSRIRASSLAVPPRSAPITCAVGMAQNRKNTCNWVCQVRLASMAAETDVVGVSR